MSNLTNNTSSLQEILATVNALPEATNGVELPTLTNEGSASDLLSGKQLISSEGEVVTGTIATKTSSNLTASGATVTVPAGYYASQATKSVSTATQATPSISVSSSGLITASATQTAGYVSAGTKSGTKQLTTQAAKTITPTKSSQTAVASGRYTTGAVTVAAIPSQYITTTDATAAAADIRSSKTAYVNGSKVTGSIADFDGSYECSGDSTGGGSGGGASVETCTVEIVYTNNVISHLIYIDADTGSYKHLQDLNTNTTTINCVCNTSIVLDMRTIVHGYSTDNTTNLTATTNRFIFGLDAPANGVATITLMTSSGGTSGGS